MSGDRTIPRFDVVATTRRRWSKEQKRAIVAEIDVDGATLSEVARRHGIHASLLFRWRKELGSVFAAPSIGAEPTAAPATPRFLPVMQVATTSRYAHLDNDPLRNATEQIGGTIAAALHRQ